MQSSFLKSFNYALFRSKCSFAIDLTSNTNELTKLANQEKLRDRNLPILNTAEDIANAMGIAIGQLRFLAFSRTTSTISHYIRFKIAKKTGGERLIWAPMPKLKQAQQWILQNILEKLELHDAVHGFRRDRSIVSNAQPYLGKDIIINFDLKDFFPSISYRNGYANFVAMVNPEKGAEFLEQIRRIQEKHQN